MFSLITKLEIITMENKLSLTLFLLMLISLISCAQEKHKTLEETEGIKVGATVTNFDTKELHTC